MEKAYNIISLGFESDFLILTLDNQTFRLKLSEISEKLAKASDEERRDFKISPSGYGINWQLLDEDLSINGLLNVSRKKHNLQQPL